MLIMALELTLLASAKPERELHSSLWQTGKSLTPANLCGDGSTSVEILSWLALKLQLYS